MHSVFFSILQTPRAPRSHLYPFYPGTNRSYWISSDSLEPRRRYCVDGTDGGGDGASATNVATDCGALINVFEAPLHADDGSVARNWLPLDETTNVALANGFMGGATAQLSDHFSDSYQADEAVDGDLGNFAHGRGGGTTAPYLQLRLPTMVRVTKIVVYNRPGSCASRIFQGTGCGNLGGAAPYNGANEGAVVRVAQAECDGEICPGVVCGLVDTPRSDQVYTIVCPKGGIVGDRVSLLLPGDGRVLNIAEVQVYGDAAMRECSATGKGASEDDPGRSCASIRREFPDQKSGESIICFYARPPFLTSSSPSVCCFNVVVVRKRFSLARPPAIQLGWLSHPILY